MPGFDLIEKQVPAFALVCPKRPHTMSGTARSARHPEEDVVANIRPQLRQWLLPNRHPSAPSSARRNEQAEATQPPPKRGGSGGVFPATVRSSRIGEVDPAASIISTAGPTRSVEGAGGTEKAFREEFDDGDEDPFFGHRIFPMANSIQHAEGDGKRSEGFVLTGARRRLSSSVQIVENACTRQLSNNTLKLFLSASQKSVIQAVKVSKSNMGDFNDGDTPLNLQLDGDLGGPIQRTSGSSCSSSGPAVVNFTLARSQTSVV